MLTFEYVLVFWRKGKQACTAISVWHLLPFLSAAPNCTAIVSLFNGLHWGGFFLLFGSHFHTSPLLLFFLVFRIFLQWCEQSWTLYPVTMCHSSPKHNWIALIFWMLFHTQQIPTFCCLRNHFIFFEISVFNCIYEAFKLFVSANATLYSTYLRSVLFAIMLPLF